MISKFSVLQFAPDLIADEKVNVGILCWQKNRIILRVLKDWRRVRSFAGNDAACTYIEKLLVGLEEGIAKIIKPGREEFLIRYLGQWVDSLTLTTPRASTLGVVELADQMAKLMLKEPEEISDDKA